MRNVTNPSSQNQLSHVSGLSCRTCNFKQSYLSKSVPRSTLLKVKFFCVSGQLSQNSKNLFKTAASSQIRLQSCAYSVFIRVFSFFRSNQSRWFLGEKDEGSISWTENSLHGSLWQGRKSKKCMEWSAYFSHQVPQTASSRNFPGLHCFHAAQFLCKTI